MYGQPMYGQPMMTPAMQPMMTPVMQPMMTPMVQPVMAPMYAPQPPPVNTGPTIIKIDGNKGSPGLYCQFCQNQTGQITRKTVGCVAIAWGFFYLFATGMFCCIPCCVDKYKDTELICVKCQQIKQTIPAQCC